MTYEESIAQNICCGARRGPENVVPRVFGCSEKAKWAVLMVAPVNPHVLSPESVGDDCDGDEYEEHAAVDDVEETTLAVA
jgi:hypothetical protein